MNQNDINENALKTLIQSYEEYEKAIKHFNEFLIASGVYVFGRTNENPFDKMKVLFADNIIKILKMLKEQTEEFKKIQEQTK